MRRILFHTAAGVSFVLLVSLCVIWVRSYWRLDNVIIHPTPTRSWDISVFAGRIAFTSQAGFPHPEETGTVTYFAGRLIDSGSHPNPNADAHWAALGFEYERFDDKLAAVRPEPYWFIAIPLWFVAYILALLPCIWLWKSRRRRQFFQRAGEGRCPRCAYDLRPTQSPNCPECGSTRWLD
ncbi:MAG: hypothetical protein WD768_15230 [Phycisphaeraceae bacterium]